MARPKGTPAPKADMEKDLALQEVISKLKAAGGSQYSITIRAKPFGTHLWTIRQKGVAVDSVDDLAAYCAQTWGPGNDYRVEFWSTDGKPATDEKGRLIPKYDLPASETGMLPASGPHSSGGDVTSSQQREIDRLMREMEMRRRRLEVEREKRRLERLEREEEMRDEEEEEGPVFYPQYGLNNWQQAPWMQQPFQRREENGSDKIAAAAITALGAVAAERRSGGGSDIEMLKILLPLMLAKGQDSGDVMKIMAPIMEMTTRAQTDASRFMLENTSESNRMMMENVIRMMKIGGEPDDKIEQFKKYIKLATDGLGDAAKVIFNRGSLLPGKEIEVPRLPKPQTPGLPSPATVPPTPQQAGKQDGPAAQPATPADVAKQVIAQRVRAFLVTHEQELLVESDPGFVVEKLEELWLALPASVREKIEAATATDDLHTVYEVLGSLDEEVTARILKTVGDDTTGKRKEWCREFWKMIAGPEEEEDEDDDNDDDDGSEPEPDSVPPTEAVPSQG
jgi:hypothetical protein